MKAQVPYSDEELLALFLNGNEKFFTLIYDRYWDRLLAVSFRILEDESLAKDCVQEVFVSLYEKAGSRSIDNLQAYLIQSTKFQCFMQLRSGKINEKHLQRMDRVISSNTIEEAFDANELEHYLESRIALLPEKCREVFTLSRVDMLSNQKIAEQLHISQKTVENQLTKALKRLRTSVERIALFLALFLSF
jgi:RNA polymerase sigma-70 factor (family 1)